MKLKGLHKTAISHAEQEEELLRKALQKITEIRNIKSERRIQVLILFKRKREIWQLWHVFRHDYLATRSQFAEGLGLKCC